MAEDYVRPPILAVEPPSRRAAAWRFRLVMTLVVLALAAGIAYFIHMITSSSDNGGTVGAPHAGVVTAPRGR